MAHWSPDSIRQLLLASSPAVARAVVAIYERQTASEKSQRATLEENGIGYNAADAAPMTQYARILLSGQVLNLAQAVDARNRILKYSGQLLSIAIEKQVQALCAA